VDSYSCLTEVVAIFYSLSVSGVAMGRYLNIILIMSDHTFFFNKKIACSSSMSAFMANALNSIMKSTVFCFPCLKILIFYLASAAFVLFVKNKRSGLNIFLFSSLILFYFDLFPFILFLETRVRVRVTRFTLSHSMSHQMTWSQVTEHMEE